MIVSPTFSIQTVLVAETNDCSMHIPISLTPPGLKNSVGTRALIDCGAGAWRNLHQHQLCPEKQPTDYSPQETHPHLQHQPHQPRPGCSSVMLATSDPLHTNVTRMQKNVIFKNTRQTPAQLTDPRLICSHCQSHCSGCFGEAMEGVPRKFNTELLTATNYAWVPFFR